MLTIINADDLGLSTAVNGAIFDLMEQGHITSSSLLANAPAAEEAVVEARRQKNGIIWRALECNGIPPTD